MTTLTAMEEEPRVTPRLPAPPKARADSNSHTTSNNGGDAATATGAAPSSQDSEQAGGGARALPPAPAANHMNDCFHVGKAMGTATSGAESRVEVCVTHYAVESSGGTVAPRGSEVFYFRLSSGCYGAHFCHDGSTLQMLVAGPLRCVLYFSPRGRCFQFPVVPGPADRPPTDAEAAAAAAALSEGVKGCVAGEAAADTDKDATMKKYVIIPAVLGPKFRSLLYARRWQSRQGPAAEAEAVVDKVSRTITTAATRLKPDDTCWAHEGDAYFILRASAAAPVAGAGEGTLEERSNEAAEHACRLLTASAFGVQLRKEEEEEGAVSADAPQEKDKSTEANTEAATATATAAVPVKRGRGRPKKLKREAEEDKKDAASATDADGAGPTKRQKLEAREADGGVSTYWLIPYVTGVSVETTRVFDPVVYINGKRKKPNGKAPKKFVACATFTMGNMLRQSPDNVFHPDTEEISGDQSA